MQIDQCLTRCRLTGGKQLIVQGHTDVSEDFLLFSVCVQLEEEQKGISKGNRNKTRIWTAHKFKQIHKFKISAKSGTWRSQCRTSRDQGIIKARRATWNHNTGSELNWTEQKCFWPSQYILSHFDVFNISLHLKKQTKKSLNWKVCSNCLACWFWKPPLT